MDLNVKIEVSPSIDIPNKLLAEVMQEIGIIANISMPFEVGVWYGPKHSKVSDKFYMFHSTRVI